MPVCRKPISGTALMTVSPLMVRIRRSTPCVLGCCGPMLMVMVSICCRSAPTWLSSTVYGVSICCFCICPRYYSLSPVSCSIPGQPPGSSLPYTSLGFLGSWLLALVDITAVLIHFAAKGRAHSLAAHAWINVVWHLSAPVWLRQIKAGEWVVFAQGVSRPVHRHQDTAQVRMAAKSEAKEIVYLALIPVGGRPYTRDARYSGMLFALSAHTHFEAQFALIGYREQVIDHVVARYALRPVYRSDSREKIVAQSFVKICAHGQQVSSLQHNGLLAAKIACFKHSLRKFLPHHLECRCRRNRHVLFSQFLLSRATARVSICKSRTES